MVEESFVIQDNSADCSGTMFFIILLIVLLGRYSECRHIIENHEFLPKLPYSVRLIVSKLANVLSVFLESTLYFCILHE